MTGVRSVVQAGFVSQPQHLFEEVLAQESEERFEDKVANVHVLLRAILAELDVVVYVVVCTEVVNILKIKDVHQFCITNKCLSHEYMSL